MKKLLFISMVTLVMASCNNETQKTVVTPTFSLDSAKMAIAESNKTYGEGFAKADSSLFISKYTKDGCIMPANAPKLCGSQAIGMFFKGAQGMGVQNIRLTTEEVMGGPEVVVETGQYELLGAENKSLDKGKFVVVWKMEDGKWKMHRDIFTTDAAPATQ
ncbi:YybH family protein [Ferruginibacter yonginensis]|uniref:YybH family protein n=1 Tax=Ferruginibacter yonginensis TaxID=1310416 RepID=A0ABV8QW82_9BACT